MKKTKVIIPAKYKAPSINRDRKYLKILQAKNMGMALGNPNENWMRDKLASTGRKWKRQVLKCRRIFDFFNEKLKTGVEVDGPEHNEVKDKIRDEYFFRRFGIIVLRVRNRNESDAKRVIDIISNCEEWKTRREWLGLQNKGSLSFYRKTYNIKGYLHQEYIRSNSREELARNWSEPNG